MLPIDTRMYQVTERELRRLCPSPETQLTELSKIMAELPKDEKSAKLRLLMVDINEITSQTRWHLGQALLLLEAEPSTLTVELATIQ